MKAEDLTGKKFGKLTVLSLHDKFYSKNGRLRRRWLCQCDCGNQIIADGDYLRRGQRTYCGKCEAPPWADAYHRICRRCEWAQKVDGKVEWTCTHGYDTILAKTKCDGYWCSSHDKLNGTKHRESVCVVCGKPVYGYKREAPIYCFEHRYYSERDREAIENMPTELLFCLIQGIFERARIDYMTNEDGQRSDAEVFLRGEWAQELSLSKFDADEVIRLMDEEIADELDRDREDPE